LFSKAGSAWSATRFGQSTVFPAMKRGRFNRPSAPMSDVDQNGVDAVERRTAVEAKRQHTFLYISAGASGGFPRIMSEAG
jgi:hypothetical protein